MHDAAPSVQHHARRDVIPSFFDPMQHNIPVWDGTHFHSGEESFNLMMETILERFVQANIHCLWLGCVATRNNLQFSVSRTYHMSHLGGNVRCALVNQHELGALNCGSIRLQNLLYPVFCGDLVHPGILLCCVHHPFGIAVLLGFFTFLDNSTSSRVVAFKKIM